jgi:hypothetical protein
MTNPDYNRLALSTGYYPISNRACVRCFSPFADALYQTCANCRDADVLMPAVAAIRAEWEASKILTVPTWCEVELEIYADEVYTRQINYPM